ncbi:hypothetical protein ABBQ32_002069 [Trebouxia sp. C0010 RCD-2024]
MPSIETAVWRCQTEFCLCQFVAEHNTGSTLLALELYRDMPFIACVTILMPLQVVPPRQWSGAVRQQCLRQAVFCHNKPGLVVVAEYPIPLLGMQAEAYRGILMFAIQRSAPSLQGRFSF